MDCVVNCFWFNCSFYTFVVFTVITTGLIKCSSKNLSNLMICLYCVSYLSSLSTFSYNFSRTLLPFCCTGRKISFMIGLAMWFFDFPNLVHSFGHFFIIHFIKFDSIEVSVMWSTFLPAFFLAVRVIPSFRRMWCFYPWCCLFCFQPGVFDSRERSMILILDPGGVVLQFWLVYCWNIWNSPALSMELFLL